MRKIRAAKVSYTCPLCSTMLTPSARAERGGGSRKEEVIYGCQL